MVWPISAGARAWVRNYQGVEAPRPLVLAQKDTQKGKSQLGGSRPADDVGRQREEGNL